jgi:threonine dehydrogenase-like Zn-dependent dehydrogenase
LNPDLPHPDLLADVVILVPAGSTATDIARWYRSRGANVAQSEAARADVAVVVSGDDDNLETALRLLRPGGALVILNGAESDGGVPADEIVLSELELYVVPDYARP